MSPDDREVAALFLRGDPPAVGLIDDWIARAARPYRSRLGSEWPDLLQEARMKTFRLLRRGDFRGESSLKTYLWHVVNHTCLDRVRALHRRKEETLDAGVPAAGDRSESPLERLLEKESRDLAWRVLVRTSVECRHLWSMVLEGLSYREMSARVGVAEGALRVRVLRCRKKAIEIRDELLRAEPRRNGGDRAATVER